MILPASVLPIPLHCTFRLMRSFSGLSLFRRVVLGAWWMTIVFAIGVVVLTLPSTPALAQPHPGQEDPALSPFGTPSATVPPASAPGSSLPDWAEPQEPSARAPSQWDGSNVPMTDMNGPPDNPNRVPLGGLEWLLAAGAGYAILRLRKQPSGA